MNLRDCRGNHDWQPRKSAVVEGELICLLCDTVYTPAFPPTKNFYTKVLKAEDVKILKTRGFDLINDNEDYKDFYKCEDLTKTENLRAGITFDCETAKFYGFPDIQSDFTDACREYGTSEQFDSLPPVFEWLAASRLEFQPIIEELKPAVSD